MGYLLCIKKEQIMNYECQVCFARFHETDMNRAQQEEQICPNCGHVDLKVITEGEAAKELDPKEAQTRGAA